MNDDIGLAGVRVLECVGESFLNDPIGREADGTWERERLAVDVQADAQARAADLFQQGVQPVETWLWRELCLVPVAAHRSATR